MNKKIPLIVGTLLLSSSAYACGSYVYGVVDYQYVGPNYSGYYNYAPDDFYPYVGPNYSGYYNYGPDVIAVAPVTVEVVSEVALVKPVVVTTVAYPEYVVVSSNVHCCVMQ